MSSELVPWRKPPRVISPELLTKKEGLRLREALWVYNDFAVTIAASPALAVGVLWLALPLTLHWLAWLLTLTATLVALAGLITALYRSSEGTNKALGYDENYREPRPGTGYQGKHVTLSHFGRKRLCLYDRNRKLAPHRARFRDGELEKQYSIWPDVIDGQSALIVIEHVKPNRSNGPWYAKILERHEVGKERAILIDNEIVDYDPLIHGDRNDWFYKQKAGTSKGIRYLGTNPTFNDMVDAQYELEAMIEALEEERYRVARLGLEQRRDILQLRRAK